MRLLCLNVWGGRKFATLTKFVQEYRQETDIFCFQEVFHTSSNRRRAGKDRANLLDELTRLLPDFNYIYEPTERGYDNERNHYPFDLTIGLATFVRKPFSIIKAESLYVFGKQFGMQGDDFATAGRPVLVATVKAQDKSYVIANFHGLWNRNYRRDDPDRLEQSRKLRRVMESWKSPAVLCGDFNLNPDTRSFRMLSEGWQDLISDFEITDTRSSLFPYEDRYCDYMLVSPGVTIRSFSVPNVTVSDHLPLVADLA